MTASMSMEITKNFWISHRSKGQKRRVCYQLSAPHLDSILLYFNPTTAAYKKSSSVILPCQNCTSLSFEQILFECA